MAQKNSNYNYLKFSNVLAANNSSGALGVADDIAYDWTDTTTDPGGNPKFVMNKSVKDKISEIELTIDNINIDEISELIGSIESDVQSAKSSAVAASAYSALALSAYANSLLFVADLSTAKSNALTEIENATADIKNRLDDTQTKITSIEEYASVFQAALDGGLSDGAGFAIVSENQYNKDKEDGVLADDTIYFCYDPESVDLPDTVYSVDVSSNDILLGSTIGSGTYAAGDDVTVRAYPSENASFIGWKYATSDTSYFSTNATITINNINANATYIAYFLLNASKYNVYISSNNYAAGNVHFTSTSNTEYLQSIVSGTSVMLIADTPAENYKFVCWQINGVNSDNTGTTLTFTPTGDTLIMGIYERNDLINITTTVEEINSEIPGTIEGGGIAQKGQTVVLNATANTGYTFVKWVYDTDTESTTNPLFLTNRQTDLNITAIFLTSE